MKTVYQISDCHLSDESSYENLKQALIHAEQDTSCDTLLLTGDICCNPKSGDYAKLVAFVTQHVTNKTIFAIAGNARYCTVKGIRFSTSPDNRQLSLHKPNQSYLSY